MEEDFLSELASITGTPVRTSVNKPGAYDSLFEKYGRKYDVDPELLKAMTNQESRFKPGATSHKGASGLMQLMPGTARDLGVKDIYDPDQNIEGGTKYIKRQLDKYKGNVSLALAAYNAGPGAVDKYGDVPPYKETRDYVKKITAAYGNGSGYLTSTPSTFLAELDGIKDEEITPQPSSFLEELSSINTSPAPMAQDLMPAYVPPGTAVPNEPTPYDQRYQGLDLNIGGAPLPIPQKQILVPPTKKATKPRRQGSVTVDVGKMTPIEELGAGTNPLIRGKGTDSLNTVAHEYQTKKTESPEQATINSIVSAGIPRDQAQAWAEARRRDGIPIHSSTLKPGEIIQVPNHVLDEIRGGTETRDDMRMQQAQGRTNLEELPPKTLLTPEILNSLAGGETFNALEAGVRAGGSHLNKNLAGAARLLHDTTGIGDDRILNALNSEAKRHDDDLAALTKDSRYASAVSLLGRLPIDLSRLGVMSRIPGGIVAASAADLGTVAASDRRNDYNKIAHETVKGALLGGIAKYTAPVAQGIYSATGSKALSTAATIAFAGGGSAAVEYNYGASTKEALYAGVLNTLFAAIDLKTGITAGKLIRARNNANKSVTMKVEADGTLTPVELKDDQVADYETVVVDEKESIAKANDILTNEKTPAVSEESTPVGETALATDPVPADQTVPVQVERRGIRQRVADFVYPEYGRRTGELEQRTNSAERAAMTDELTGLQNTRALNQAKASADADPTTEAVFVDANNFGQVNKILGDAAGDEALKLIGRSLQDAADQVGGVRVFRKGGDEFVMYAPKGKGQQVADLAAVMFDERKGSVIPPDYTGPEVSITGTAGDNLAAAEKSVQQAKAIRKGTAPETSYDRGDFVTLKGNPDAVYMVEADEGGNLVLKDAYNPEDPTISRVPKAELELYHKADQAETGAPAVRSEDATIDGGKAVDLDKVQEMTQAEVKPEQQVKVPENLQNAASRFISTIENNSDTTTITGEKLAEPAEVAMDTARPTLTTPSPKKGQEGFALIPSVTQIKELVKSIMDVPSRDWYQRIKDPIERMKAQRRATKDVRFESARLKGETEKATEGMTDSDKIEIIDAMEHNYTGPKWDALTPEQKAVATGLRPIHDAIQSYNDTFNVFSKADLAPGTRYLYHWWVNPDTGRPYASNWGEFSKSGPSGRQRTIDTYESGRGHLDMATMNPGELLGKSMEQMIQVKEARDLIGALRKDTYQDPDGTTLKYIVGKVPKGLEDRYTLTDIPSLSSKKYIPSGDDVGLLIEQPVYVLKELEPKITAFFKKPEYSKVDEILNTTKSFKLTGTFFHGLGLLLKNTSMFRFRHINDIKKGQAHVREMDDTMKRLYRNGLDTALGEEYADLHAASGQFHKDSMFGKISDTIIKKNPMTKLVFGLVRTGLKNAYAHDTYTKMEPLYVARMEKQLGRPLKGGEFLKAQDEAARATVERSDNLFSGEDKKFGALEASNVVTKYYFSPEAQRWWQRALLSPTWQREHMIEAKNLVKSVTMPGTVGPIAREHIKQAMGVAVIMSTADLYNYYMTKWMDGEGTHLWNNPSGSRFSLRAPWNEPEYSNESGKTTKGGPAYIRPFKAITEIPEVIAAAWPTEKGDIIDKISSKATPIITATVNQLSFSDQPREHGAVERLKQVGADFAPIGATVPYNVAQGKRSAWDLVPWALGAAMQKPQAEDSKHKIAGLVEEGRSAFVEKDGELVPDQEAQDLFNQQLNQKLTKGELTLKEVNQVKQRLRVGDDVYNVKHGTSPAKVIEAFNLGMDTANQEQRDHFIRLMKGKIAKSKSQNAKNLYRETLDRHID